MTDKFSLKKFLISIIVGCMTALLGAFLMPEAYAVGAVTTAAIGAAWGITYSAFGAILGGVSIVCSNLSEPLYAAIYLALFALCVVLFTVGARKKLAYRYMAALAALLVLAVLYTSFCIPSLMAGKPAYSELKDYFLRADELYSESFPDMDSGYASIAGNIDILLYGMLILIAEGAGFLSTVYFRLMCGLFKADMRPMAKFVDWELPSSLRIGVPILAIGCIILSAAGYYASATVTVAVICLLLPLLSVEGIAGTAFLFSSGVRSVSKKKQPGALVYVFLTLMALMAPMMMAALGLVELYARRRPKLRLMNQRIREAFEKAEREKSNVVSVDFGDGRGPQIIATRKRDDGIFFDSDLNLEDKPPEEQAKPSGADSADEDENDGDGRRKE